MKFRNDFTVSLIDVMGSDENIVSAARVSSGIEGNPKADKGLINFLMRERHGSPFEHSSMTLFVEAPIFVFREFQRHRIASYNEESGRYKELAPTFYVIGEDRPLKQEGKPGAYSFTQGTPEQYNMATRLIAQNASDAYHRYQAMLDAGVAREVARMVLPLNIYSSMYVTVNARSLMNFLSLRSSEQGTYPSYPQQEIAQVAAQIEEQFAELFPLTHAAFIANGRVAP